MRASLGTVHRDVQGRCLTRCCRSCSSRWRGSKNYSEVMISFMESYTSNVIALILEREGKLPSPTNDPTKKQSQAAKYKLYNLDIFWTPIQDSSLLEGKN